MMKKFLITFTLFGALFFIPNTAQAKVFIYSNGEKISIAKRLPDDALINGEHVNIGVMYKQFAIFWIPVWNYGEKEFVLVNDKKDTYYDLDEEDIEILKTEYDTTLPSKPKINFWNKIGGKIIWGAVILALGYGYLSTRKDEE